jgi:N-acetylmuramoyl-L-alanine amidase
MKLYLLFLLFIATQSVYGQTFIAGRTTGPLPFLEYGLGDDRLGGAKMGYLDSNIALRVIDSFKTDYKIQLSAFHTGWLSKQSFRADTSLHFAPYYLSTSWRVWGDDRYDYVSIGLPERLPYKVIQQVDPARIVVDIYGVTSNTNWITQLKTVKEIKNVWYEQPEDDMFRVIIELKYQQHWGYFLYYNRNALQVRVKRQPSSLRPKNLVVAIDAGHGGTNTGAGGSTDSTIMEKDYTLKIATQLEKYLKRKNVTTFMTRTKDTTLDMVERTMMLRQRDPDILISIHLNSAGNATVKGTSTYYRYIGFRPLTQQVLDRMLELGLNNYGNIGNFNFALSGPTEYPNCLVEVAFLSNPEDEAKILDPDFQKAVAKKIYKGIDDWLKALRKDN